MSDLEKMYTWYEIARDFAPAISTVVAVLISVWYAVSQLKTQHNNALKQQAEEHKKKVQLELFESLQDRLDTCAALSESLSTDLIVKNTILRAGYPINHDESALIQQISTVLKSVTEITIYIEHREIISPRLFRLFRSALHSAHYDMMQQLRAPQIEDVQRFESISRAASEASNYCHDINVCLQNLAYKNIFESQAPVREPLDPRFKVLVDEPASVEELIQYFEHETPYGRNMDETNARVAQELANGAA